MDVRRVRGLFVVAGLTLIMGCGSSTPSAENLDRNDKVLASTPLPDGTEEVTRTSHRHDVEGRYCVDVTTLVLRPPTGQRDEAIVAFFDEHFGSEGWALDHGEAAAGLVVSYEGGTAWVDVSTERLGSGGTYALDATQPC